MPPKGSNQLRIIGGSWRGRKLGFPDVEGLRPTGDRIRETLFNWLAPDIAGARCLDLFAGSGALGLEALSRGAGESVLIEKNPLAAQSLVKNLALLNAEKAQVINTDTLSFLSNANSVVPFDVVFIDPPFQQNLWQQTIDLLEQQKLLSESCVIYVESGIEDQYEVPASWELHRDKTTAKVRYRLFYRRRDN
ncbi:MAG TPA: 16S rRNA (guanine(966)-N(2))-methyltransferase RsmD [Cellvibrio sp.]|nr:16S rRNA (guanine(966)-N(2))-methyltransferase RsmD [Cellvibrio sp.]